MRERCRTGWRTVARSRVVYSIWRPWSQKRGDQRGGVARGHGAAAPDDSPQCVEGAIEIVVDHDVVEFVVVLQLRPGGAHSTVDDRGRVLASSEPAANAAHRATVAG